MLEKITRLVPNQPWLALLLPALLAMVISAIPTLVEGIPAPVIEDEWGYLLTADTFVEGRLTNPTHEHWEQLEAVHQFHVPSYNSKYPPGQSLFLALGQLIWHPILGVWLSIGLMIASIIWMLQGILPNRWAWVGGFVALAQYVVLGQPFQMGTFGYWSQSYWGGAVAAAGGAMMFGALPRIERHPKVSTAIVMALGVLLVANTRPMEGFLASLPAAAFVVVWLFRQRFSKVALTKVVLPSVLVLAAGLAAMGVYNKAVTGKATEMPWNTHYEQYCIFPVMLWQDLLPDKDWNHREMEVFHGKVEAEMHTRHGTIKGFIKSSLSKLVRTWVFYVGPFFTIPLLFFLLPMLRVRWVRFAMLPITLVFGSILVKFGSPPHYSAPIACLMVALIVQSLRYALRFRFREMYIGRPIVAALMLVALAGIGYGLHRTIHNVRATNAEYRIRAQKVLEQEKGQHLVLVRFGPLHGEGDHWIWNAANIDEAKVVWIRDPGDETREEMLRYFEGRKVWRADVGYAPGEPHLVPYAGQ